MNDYYDVRLDLSPCSEDATDLLAGMLADIGYESFVADSEGLNAFVPAGDYDPEALRSVIVDFPIPSTYITIGSTLVEGRDWNAEWERNYFKPIVIGNRCVVHSSFHTDVPEAEFDIVIDPKMAFGTGHHSTTSLIITRLLNMDLDKHSVIDMGTGTGILAILCAMRGASPVIGIEIDGFAIANARENVAANGHPEISLIEGDASALQHLEQADIFIANINRNVILADLAAYTSKLKKGGRMLLSGFYVEDVDMLIQAAAPLGLSYVDMTENQNWASICLKKD